MIDRSPQSQDEQTRTLSSEPATLASPASAGSLDVALGHATLEGSAEVDRLWCFSSDFDALWFPASASVDRAELEQRLAAGMPGAVHFVYAERVGPLVPHVEGQMRSEGIGLRPSAGSRVVVLARRALPVPRRPGSAATSCRRTGTHLPTIVMVAVRELLVFWPLTLD